MPNESFKNKYFDEKENLKPEYLEILNKTNILKNISTLIFPNNYIVLYVDKEVSENEKNLFYNLLNCSEKDIPYILFEKEMYTDMVE